MTASPVSSHNFCSMVGILMTTGMKLYEITKSWE